MATFLLLAGAKGVGKSWVADIAQQEFGVHYVDADLLILDLIERGVEPDPLFGWLEPVRAAVLDALRSRPFVSAEITGAWDSDYKLAGEVEQGGHQVVRVLISAPLEETLERLRMRRTRKVPVSEDEARSEYARVQERVARERWDARLDTSGVEDRERATRVLRQLLSR